MMELRTTLYRDQNPVFEPESNWAARHPAGATTLYSVLSLAIALAATWFFSAEQSSDFLHADKKRMYLTLILVVGIGYMIVFPRQLGFRQMLNGQTGLLYFSLAVAIGLLTMLVLFLAGLTDWQLALAAFGSFLLPYMVMQCWNSFDTIFTKPLPIWYLPQTLSEKKVALIFLNSLQIRVVIKKNSTDKVTTCFPVTAPATMPLGKMFQQFVNDQDELGKPIEIETNYRRSIPYGWRFVLKKPFGSTQLNPATTLRDNAIKPQDIILIERVQARQGSHF